MDGESEYREYVAFKLRALEWNECVCGIVTTHESGLCFTHRGDRTLYVTPYLRPGPGDRSGSYLADEAELWRPSKQDQELLGYPTLSGPIDGWDYRNQRLTIGAPLNRTELLVERRESGLSNRLGLSGSGTSHPATNLGSPAEPILIDDEVTSLVQALWSRGYRTYTSCQGGPMLWTLDTGDLWDPDGTPAPMEQLALVVEPAIVGFPDDVLDEVVDLLRRGGFPARQAYADDFVITIARAHLEDAVTAITRG